jgi:hypothetical protein
VIRHFGFFFIDLYSSLLRKSLAVLVRNYLLSTYFRSLSPHFAFTGKTNRTPYEFVYEVLLPALVSRPFLTNMTQPDPAHRWIRPPVFGDRSVMHLLFESVFYCLCKGIGAVTARFFLYLIQWEMAKSLRRDVLQHAPLPPQEKTIITFITQRMATMATEEASTVDTRVNAEMVWFSSYVYLLISLLHFSYNYFAMTFKTSPHQWKTQLIRQMITPNSLYHLLYKFVSLICFCHFFQKNKNKN